MPNSTATTATVLASGATSMTFSPDSSRLYIARSNGSVTVIDTATRSTLATWTVGTQLGGTTITDDGRYLLTTERSGSQSLLYRIDTTDGSVTSYARAGTPFEDVQVVNGRTAILSGGGTSQLTTFDLTGLGFGTIAGGVTRANTGNLSRDGIYTIDGELSYLAPLAIYSDLRETLSSSDLSASLPSTVRFLNVDQFGIQALSERLGIVLRVMDQYAVTFAVNNLQNGVLSTPPYVGVSLPTLGMAFDPLSEYLYYVDGTGKVARHALSSSVTTSTIANLGAMTRGSTLTYGDQFIVDRSDSVVAVRNMTTGAVTLIGDTAANDLISGTTGADALAGGIGSDRYVIDNAGDTITELADQGLDTAIASVSHTLSANVERLELTGTAANGTGTDRANDLVGNAGDNILSGLGGNDMLYGNDGNDTLLGGDGDDTLFGGNGNDRLEGGAGADKLYGGTGSDYIIAASGDVIDGGDGIDTVDFSAAASGVSGAGVNVENVIGSAFNDSLTIVASGDYSLHGGGGNDTLTANGGNNLIDGGTGADVMAGGAGDDTYLVDNAGDTISEGANLGFDQAIIRVSFTLNTNAQVEYLSALSTPVAGQLNITGNSFAQTIYGNDGVNDLRGGGGADTLYGQGGNDFLNGGVGAQTMYGGTGDDWYSTDVIGDVAIEYGGEGYDRVLAGQGTFILTAGSEIELLAAEEQDGSLFLINLTGNEFGQTLIGNNAANVLNGGGGVDTLYGLNGNDTLDGGTGADQLIGGLGNDQYVVDDLNDLIIELDGQGLDQVIARGSFRLSAGASIEYISALSTPAGAQLDITANAVTQTIYGNDAANAIEGGGGADTIYGQGGNDYLSGGAGAQTIYGGFGNDWIYVDDAADLAIEYANEGDDRLLAAVSYRLGTGSEIELLAAANQGGAAALDLRGNEYAQAIIGNEGVNLLEGFGGDDTLYGLGGDDVLDGGTGADQLVGGTGNDWYFVDNASDAVFENVGEGSDRVLTRVSFALSASAEIELLSALDQSGATAIDLRGSNSGQSIIGNEGANRIDGLAGNDTLYGLGGADILDGGLGFDYLVGGTGADTFAFSTALGGDNFDRITDFVSGTDRIQLSQSIFAALGLGGIAAGQFVAGTAALDADDRILYDQASGTIWYDADGNGGGAAVAFAQLNAGTTLVASDFIVV